MKRPQLFINTKLIEDEEVLNQSLLDTYQYSITPTTFKSRNLKTKIDISKVAKKTELDLYKKMEASRIAYDFLILQHASLKCFLEEKYDKLIYVTIYNQFIAPNINVVLLLK